MKHYIDENGQVFAYEEDGSQDHLIGNKTLLPEEQVESAQTAWFSRYVNNMEYDQARRLHYPSIGDQLDALWHAMDSGQLPKIQNFYEPIQLVKQQFPKNII
jgi:hypothetical protein